MMGFAAFRNEKYLSIETFRKSGQGVKTPVWFAADPNTDIASESARLFFYTIGVSGKVKRIRNNPRVKIAPCKIRGEVTGEWQDGRVEIIAGEEARRAANLVRRKYFPLAHILSFFARFSRRERIVMAITPA
jgi:PPOX class probable F420-dependent enzyme